MPSRTLILRVGLACLVLVAGAIGLWMAAPETRAPALIETPRIARLLLELRDGQLCPKDGGGPFTGIMFEQTPEGQVISEIPLKEGIVHGIARGWHDNGQMEVEEPFEDGVSNGLRTRWHPNGQKRSEATIVNGVLQGPFSEWHDNGQVAVRMEMVDGKGEGVVEAWNPDGSMKSRVTLAAGEPVETAFFSESDHWQSSKDGE
mgnify:CR=1 FL=1